MSSGAQRPSGIAPAQTWQEHFASTRVGGALVALAQRVGRSLNPPSAPPANMWNGLTSDVLRQVSGFLPVEGIPRVARVSSTWRNALTNRSIGADVPLVVSPEALHLDALNRAVLYLHAQRAGTTDFVRDVPLERAMKLYQTGNIIGEATWKRIGNPGDIPLLTAETAALLESQCPFSQPGRRIIDTHLLVWIPKKVTRTVNGREETVDVTLINLCEHENQLGENQPGLIPGAKYGYMSPAALAQHGNDTPAKGRWLLIPKEVIPGSTNLNFDQQQAFVADRGREMPHAVEIAVALFMKQFYSPGTYLLDRNHWRYTRCLETVQPGGGGPQYPLIVGAFSRSGLRVDGGSFDRDFSGVVGPAEVQILGH